MEIKNYMEALVWKQLENVLEAHPDVCRCERCRYDVVALALNSLPPKYVVSEKGTIFARVSFLEMQFRIDIIAAITSAIEKVNSMPHHEQEEKDSDSCP